jgi:hypothetical protein
MTRSIEAICDYCTETRSARDEEDLLDWISVDFYDTISEEHKELDFCSSECIVSYFS